MKVFPSIVRCTGLKWKFPLPSFLIIFVLVLFFFGRADAGVSPPVYPPDSSGNIVVRSIRIEGNKQTRRSIILRELPFAEQEILERKLFPGKIQAGRENVFNTGLFNIVAVDTAFSGVFPEQVDVTIHVIERWYIWPIPFFEISDRNFNTWLKTTDLSRLSYGIDLSVSNVRGRNEKLDIPIHYGFNQMIGFGYKMPYLNRKKTLGIAFGAEFSRNHEVIVETWNNKTVYYKDPFHFPRENFYAYAEWIVRPSFNSRHTLRAGFNDWYFSDSLLRVPGYAYEGYNVLTYFSLFYQYKNDHRDIQFYPLHGFYFDAELVQNGLWSYPVNEFFVKMNYRKYMQLWHRWYFATGVTAKVTLTDQPPYFLQRGLGYGRDFVRGYEYYVVDGKSYLLWKNNFKFAILPQRVVVLSGIKSSKFNTIPLALYMNVFCDAGYVYNTDTNDTGSNDLRNSLLLGYGTGLDFTTYYDIVVRIELSVNRMGEPGLYLHFMAPI